MTTTTNNTQPVNNKERENGMAGKAIAGATVVAASAGTGVLADELYRANDVETQDEVAQAAGATVNPEEATEGQQQSQEPQSNEQATPQPAGGHTVQQQHPQPQPTDHTSQETTQNSDEPTIEVPATDEPINTDDLANVDPNVVSADIADAEFIDETDNDVANLPIASVGNIETADGDTLAAASLTTDTGETMYLVDVNHDNQYDVITDEQGTTVVPVTGTITTSDGYELANLNNGHEAGYQGNDENANDDNDTDMDNDIENNITDLS